MTTYAYRAAGRDGGIEAGTLDASNRDEAAAALAMRGLFPMHLASDEAPAGRRGRMPIEELALGLRVLAELLAAGLPMARALGAMQDLAPHSWRVILPGIRAAVRDGRSLAYALEDAPLVVPRAVLGTIRAGEAGSTLPSAVASAAAMMEEDAATRAAVRNALAYPLVLAVAGLGSMLLLVGVVLPRFAGIIADLGGTLPTTTRIVLRGAGLVRSTVLPVSAIVLVAALMWWTRFNTEGGRRRWHELLLRAPLVGDLRMTIATARVASSLSALLGSGVRLSAAISHAAAVAGDAAVAARLLAARELIASGERPSRALEREHALTSTAARLIRAGEETGRLAPMLAQAARIERARAERSIKAAVRLLEPALILGFAALVAVVAAALLQAIYSVRPT